MKTIMFTKEFWLSSPFSIAIRYGGIDISDKEDGKRHYLIVDGKGKPFCDTLSLEMPADLVDKEFIPLYKKLGREKFISIVKDNILANRKELKKILSDAVHAAASHTGNSSCGEGKKKEQQRAQEPSLFD